MSTSPDPNSKLSALEQQKLRLQAELARIEREEEAEKTRAEQAEQQAEEQQREQQARQAGYERARRAILQQEAARVAAERLRAEQERADRQPETPASETAADESTTSDRREENTTPPPPPAAAPSASRPPVAAQGPPEPPPSSDAPATPASAAAPPPPPTPPPAKPKKTSPTPAPAESGGDVAAAVQPAARKHPPPIAAGKKAEASAGSNDATAPAAAERPSPPAAKNAGKNAPAPAIDTGEPAASVTAPVAVAVEEQAARLQGEADEDGEPAAAPPAPRFQLRRWLGKAPPWVVSSVFHAAALMMLALMTLAIQDRTPKGLVMEAADPAPESEMLEELQDIELEPQELTELEEVSVAISAPDPGMISFSDMTAAVSEVSAADSGDVELQPTTIGEIGALFGKEGQGMSDIGDGLEAAASFFGAKSTGSRFIFVVDNSNSMGGGKFETAVTEMVRTVEGLSPRQQFFVFFFSDRAYPLFHPHPPYGMVAATEANKQKLKAWLYTVEMCLRTEGKDAMEQALKMNPDAIYILGDGAFTDNTGKLLTAPHNRRTAIHTVGMQVSEKGRKELTSIAEANKGTFRNVEASPVAKAMAKANPIKKNNSFGPIWGTDLPRKK